MCMDNSLFISSSVSIVFLKLAIFKTCLRSLPPVFNTYEAICITALWGKFLITLICASDFGICTMNFCYPAFVRAAPSAKYILDGMNFSDMNNDFAQAKSG